MISIMRFVSERNIPIREVTCLLLLWLVKGSSVFANSSIPTESFIRNKSILRPVCGNYTTVQVKIGLAIKQIIDLNEPRQILETKAWIRLEWNDCQMKWNANQTGLDSIVVPYGTIWVPDLTLYDNAENELGGLKEYRQYILHDGTVQYNFPSIIKSLCTVDVTYFPFDVQVCRFKFGSWMHNVMELNLSKAMEAGDITIYRSNGEWQILGAPAIRHEIKYLCCTHAYSDVTFYLQLERRPLFYLLNLLFPCSVISTVAILSFLLPPESGEKVSLCITVLLSLAVFLLVVSETMPPTSETFPFIGLYFASCMLLVSISCLMTVTVLNLHHKGNYGRKVPWYIRKIFLDFFGTILCQRSNYYAKTDIKTKHQRSHGIHTIEGQSTFHSLNLPNGVTVHDDNFNNSLKNVEASQLNIRMKELNASMEVVTLLQKQLESLQKLASSSDMKADIEERAGEWKLVAKIVDRIFFILFLCIQVGTTLGILARISTAEKFGPVE